MTQKPHVRQFSELDLQSDIDPHKYADERSQILWVLAEAKAHDALQYLTPAQVSDILRECADIYISRQRVTAILARERGTVAPKRVSNKKHYKIMKAGEDELALGAPISTFVDPEQALTEIRRVEELLSNLRGNLKICDPYVENRTLDYLAECTAASAIQLLTVNVYGQTKFRRDLAAFHKQHGNRLEVRVAAQSNLHDRYILHDNGLLLLGTSLNGFAKKQSFIVALGPDIRSATETAFDRSWATATKF